MRGPGGPVRRGHVLPRSHCGTKRLVGGLRRHDGRWGRMTWRRFMHPLGPRFLHDHRGLRRNGLRRWRLFGDRRLQHNFDLVLCSRGAPPWPLCGLRLLRLMRFRRSHVFLDFWCLRNFRLCLFLKKRKMWSAVQNQNKGNARIVHKGDGRSKPVRNLKVQSFVGGAAQVDRIKIWSFCFDDFPKGHVDVCF